MSCRLIPILSMGLYIEPSLHPKPGGVTPFNQDDKRYFDFLIHASLTAKIMHNTCERFQRNEKNVIAKALKEYKNYLLKFDRRNIAFGEFLLHIPLSIGILQSTNIKDVAINSSKYIIEETGKEEGILYYEILKMLSPSYLGKYEGLMPDVFSSYPKDLYEVLRAYSWDLVNGEIINGYPISLETVQYFKKFDNLNEAFLNGLLYIISRYGDTLTAKRNGFKFYKKMIDDATIGLYISKKYGIEYAINFLRDIWGKNISPGSALDILSSSISLYFLELHL
ncbi:MAG: triphosphoribosyl-dephospho-CoA synthase [Caldisphaera sp.]